MRQLVPTLVVAAGLATVCAAAGLVTGMDTVFKVASLLAGSCLVATAGINFRFEQQRARAERAHAAKGQEIFDAQMVELQRIGLVRR